MENLGKAFISAKLAFHEDADIRGNAGKMVLIDLNWKGSFIYQGQEKKLVRFIPMSGIGRIKPVKVCVDYIRPIDASVRRHIAG